MIMSKMAAAISTWRETAADAKQQQAAMRRALAKLVHGKMSAAFVSWRDMATEAKRAAHMSGGAIRRMLNRKLSAAFETWQTRYLSSKSNDTAKSFASRMLNRKL